MLSVVSASRPAVVRFGDVDRDVDLAMVPGAGEGDYVIVENRTEARNGEMVVALLGGENATLKKYYREKEEIRLQPAHPWHSYRNVRHSPT